MYQSSKLLLTQSLLSSWLYQYNAYDPQKAHESFLKVLRREPTQPNRAMLDGIQFENMVTACCEGTLPEPEHKWAEVVEEASKILKGAQFQVAVYRNKRVDGVPFLLYGRLDALKAGTIYDTKFVHHYEAGKYVSSPQHPMYFDCVPEASRFVYVISDGKAVYQEEYRREEIPAPDQTIREFMKYLEAAGLAELYIEKWKTN